MKEGGGETVKGGLIIGRIRVVAWKTNSRVFSHFFINMCDQL